MTIDDYLSQVTAALRVPAAQAGIEDLREALRERAAVVGEAAACDDFGTPQAYAADLDAAFASEEPDDFDPPPAQVFLGVPGNWSLDGSWWRRLFNPADPGSWCRTSSAGDTRSTSARSPSGCGCCAPTTWTPTPWPSFVRTTQRCRWW